jgi:hypothetical protein
VSARRDGRGGLLAVLAVLAAFAAGGCGSNVYIGSQESDPAVTEFRCGGQDGGPSGMLVLIAQSVPSASAVPCIEGEAGHWTMAEFTVRDGSAVVGFAYQYGGPDRVTVEMRAQCDVHDAREVSSRHEGTRRYNRELVRGGRYANEIHYVYEGACTSLRFDLGATGADLRGAEFAGALAFVARSELDRQIRAATDGRLTLDPAR